MLGSSPLTIGHYKSRVIYCLPHSYYKVKRYILARLINIVILGSHYHLPVNPLSDLLRCSLRAFPSTLYIGIPSTLKRSPVYVKRSPTKKHNKVLHSWHRSCIDPLIAHLEDYCKFYLGTSIILPVCQGN
jgi:hypothetical protein